MDVAAIIIVSGFAVGFTLLLFLSILFKSAHSMVAEVGTAAAESAEGLEVREQTESQVPQVQESKAEAKKVSGKTDSIDAKILELRKKGLSIKKIAKEVGLSPSTVYRRLKKLTAEKQ
ncbi:MAG: AsnC family protein [Desulfurococcales archaeon]|nr:AsnC family protein [Desulfurococcales archaeon]